MKKEPKFLVLVTACIMASPYFLQADVLTLFVFPVGVVPVLFGYVPAILLQVISFAGQPLGISVPLLIYIEQFVPGLRILFKNPISKPVIKETK